MGNSKVNFLDVPEYFSQYIFLFYRAEHTAIHTFRMRASHDQFPIRRNLLDAFDQQPVSRLAECNDITG